MDWTIKGICLVCGEEVEVDRMALATVNSTIEEFVTFSHSCNPNDLKESIPKIKKLLQEQGSKSRCGHIFGDEPFD